MFRPIRLLPLALAACLFALLFAGVAHAQEDITPPALASVTFDPPTIDTSKGPATITVTARVTDDISGAYGIQLAFRQPATTQHIQIEFRDQMGFPWLLKGDNRDGTYQGTITLPQYAAYGEWQLYAIGAEDRVGNRLDLIRPDDTEQPGKDGKGNGWPTIYNGFVFAVGLSRPAGAKLYMPALSN